MTYVYIFHATIGRDISPTAFPTLPVDVEVDGSCFLRGVGLGYFGGVFEFPSGSHNISVMPADTLSPCTMTPTLTTTVTFKANATQVMTIGEDLSDLPTAYVTDVNVAATTPGGGRIVVANVSDVRNVTVTATPQVASQGTTLTFSPARRGQSTWQDAKAINYITQIYEYGSTTNTYGYPIVVRPIGNSVVMVFVFGSKKTGSIRLVSKIIEDVF
jgi:hypothetical protein